VNSGEGSDPEDYARDGYLFNAFARAVGAEVYVADFGVRTASPAHPRLIDVRCGPGTANMARGPAIAREQVAAVLDAGVTAIVQPGGSVKDEEVIAAADGAGLAMVMTGERHFRH